MLPLRLGRWFARTEWERVSDPVPLHLEPNVLKTMQVLDAVREAIGVPIVLTSGYRTPARNARVGGSQSSDHPNALAVDFKPRGLDLHEFHRRFVEADRARKIPPYDQIIVYPYTTKHVHLGVGPRMRRQHLLRVADDEHSGSDYVPLDTTAQIPKGTATAIVVIALAVLALLYILARSAR